MVRGKHKLDDFIKLLLNYLMIILQLDLTLNMHYFKEKDSTYQLLNKCFKDCQ